MCAVGAHAAFSFLYRVLRKNMIQCSFASRKSPLFMQDKPGTQVYKRTVMVKKHTDTDELFEKRATECDGRANRAEVRRLRALGRGVQREVDGAVRTIEEARNEAAQFRAQIGK